MQLHSHWCVPFFSPSDDRTLIQSVVQNKNVNTQVPPLPAYIAYTSFVLFRFHLFSFYWCFTVAIALWKGGVMYNWKDKITIINMKEHPHSASSLSLSHLCISVSFSSFSFRIFWFLDFSILVSASCSRLVSSATCSSSLSSSRINLWGLQPTFFFST